MPENLIRIQNDTHLPKALVSVRVEKAWECLGIRRPDCVKVLLWDGSTATYDFGSAAEAKAEADRIGKEWGEALNPPLNPPPLGLLNPDKSGSHSQLESHTGTPP